MNILVYVKYYFLSILWDKYKAVVQNYIVSCEFLLAEKICLFFFRVLCHTTISLRSHGGHLQIIQSKDSVIMMGKGYDS